MIPYTYLIGWSEHRKFYYGVRYSKKSNPSELCKTYFSSSKYVKEMIKNHGVPDIQEVRKIFPNVNSARKWEHKVLRRMKCVQNIDWLNKTDNISISPDAAKYVHTDATRLKKSISHKGKVHTAETRAKISAAQKGKPREYLKGIKRPQHSSLMSIKMKEIWANRKSNISGELLK